MDLMSLEECRHAFSRALVTIGLFEMSGAEVFMMGHLEWCELGG